MATVRDTAEFLALKRRIEKLSPGDRLRLCAELLDLRKYEIAETLTSQAVDELRLVRMMRGRSGEGT
jgi:hypothetical protein